MTLREFYLTLHAAMAFSSGFDDADVKYLPDGFTDATPDGLLVEINGQQFILTAKLAAEGRVS